MIRFVSQMGETEAPVAGEGQNQSWHLLDRKCLRGGEGEVRLRVWVQSPFFLDCPV